MSKELYLVVEGQTEQFFAERVLAPYFAVRNIFVRAMMIPKKGSKGGDVKFERVKSCVSNLLKQRRDTIVATFVDYYGLNSWPELEAVRGLSGASPAQISSTLIQAAVDAIKNELPECNVSKRFVPFIAVHEFEALLFSEPNELAEALNIDSKVIVNLMQNFDSPEQINNGPQTAPSKRIENWSQKRFGKTTTGVALAERIGIDKMRTCCHNFDAWIKKIEAIVSDIP